MTQTAPEPTVVLGISLVEEKFLRIEYGGSLEHAERDHCCRRHYQAIEDTVRRHRSIPDGSSMTIRSVKVKEVNGPMSDDGREGYIIVMRRWRRAKRLRELQEHFIALPTKMTTDERGLFVASNYAKGAFLDGLRPRRMGRRTRTKYKKHN